VGRGSFIVFEGIEGSGKSTQIRLLAERFEGLGRLVTVTREPGGTPIGEAIRDLLLSNACEGAAPMTEALLHTAARAEHIPRVIRPALEAGHIVLSDRFLDSTLAYQGAGSGVPIATLRKLQHLIVADCVPDQKILLRLDVQEGLRRRMAGKEVVNRIDLSDLDFHQRVAEGFAALAAGEPGLWIVVDASLPPEVVAEHVFEGLLARLPELRTAEEPRHHVEAGLRAR
jgi:dTMP kinase